jgi:hypothetical protein
MTRSWMNAVVSSRAAVTQAARNAFLDLASIALECGDLASARLRVQQSREFLDDQQVAGLVRELESDYRVRL